MTNEEFKAAIEAAKARGDWEGEKKKLLNLPNFDYEKFEQISGISETDINS